MSLFLHEALVEGNCPIDKFPTLHYLPLGDIYNCSGIVDVIDNVAVIIFCVHLILHVATMLLNCFYNK